MSHRSNSVLVLLVLALLTPIGAVAAEDLWSDIDDSLLQPVGERVIVPDRYRAVRLDTVGLAAVLATAPMEFTDAAIYDNETVLALPMPDGGTSRFRVEESPIMTPDFQKLHPEIRTYRGYGIDDPTASARFGWTPAGFHAIVLSARTDRYLIDSHSRGDVQNYVVYWGKQYRLEGRPAFDCDIHGENDAVTRDESLGDPGQSLTPMSGGTMRTYRLAQAANYEYTAYHSGVAIPLPGNKTDALVNGIIPTVNRVNSVYNRDLAIHLELVNNDNIIFETAADPYTNESGTNMLAENQATCDSVVGTLNYDIGHVFSTGGGGVAFLGSVCGLQKAGGVTGLPAPTGDVFYIDYVSHEMGHQFGGSHTFNGSAGSCSGGNRTASQAYEVGSGSTIQAYAGICSPQNTQNNSDAYFHVASLIQMINFSTGSGDCGVHSTTSNTGPTANAGGDFTIPAQTAFVLTGSGSDPNGGDALTYTWEQFDLGAAGAGTPDNGSSPIFRSFWGTEMPTRVLPRLSDILAGGPITYGEIYPTANWNTMSFQMTVRDNRLDAGGVDWDRMEVTVDAGSGPFRVLSPNGGETWTAGATETVTWDPAGTASLPVDTPLVDIFMFLDGENDFHTPIVLAAGVPNTGSANVTAPNLSTTTARIRVKGSFNLFFDISDADFEIGGGGPAPPVAVDDSAATNQDTPVSIDVRANDTDADTAHANLEITVVQNPTDMNGSAVLNDGGTPGDFTDDVIDYTPDTGFTGTDTFQYTLADDTLPTPLTDIATVTVDVLPACAPQPTGSYSDDFESGAPGWTVDTPVNNIPASLPWMVTTSTQASSGTEVFRSGAEAADLKDDRLVSPDLAISSTSVLTFQHNYSYEDTYDGGVLEFSTNGGTSWADVISLGPVITAGGYDATIDGGFDSPIANRQAWTGFSSAHPAMNSVSVNLAALDGETVRLRWRNALDNGVLVAQGTYWEIDDVAVTNLYEVGNCPPVAADDIAGTETDVAIQIDVLANDADPNGDAITLTPMVAQPTTEGGTWSTNDNGTAGNPADDFIDYTPPAGFSSPPLDTFTYEICDTEPLCDTATVAVTVTSVGGCTIGTQLFADGFESGDFSAWDFVRNPQGDLSVTGGAALDAALGLQVHVDHSVSRQQRHHYVTKTHAAVENYCWSFLFDPNSLDMPEGKLIRIWGARGDNNRRLLEMAIRKVGSDYRIGLQGVKNGGAKATVGFHSIGDGPVLISGEWARTTGAGNDGVLRLFVDNSLKAELTNIDNMTRLLVSPGMGNLGEFRKGTLGDMYFDAFVSGTSP